MNYQADLIFDIGMHKGEDTRFYLKKGFRVVAVEANPLLVQENRKKFQKEIESGRLRILNVGIGKEEGVMPFYVNGHSTEWSSFDKSIGTRNNTPFTEIMVNCVRTKTLFDQYGVPFYMKVDIEGFDHLALVDIPENENKPRFVSCESNEVEWLDLLHSRGYRKFKLINQANGFRPLNSKLEKNSGYILYRKGKHAIKHKLRKVLPQKYAGGSSGPFGEDTRGNWKSYEEIRGIFQDYMQGERRTPVNNISWCDFHATI